MRGARERGGLGRATLAGLLLVASSQPAPQARAEAAAVARAAEVRVVDAVARGPGLEERLAEIRRRIARAVSYPPIARRRGLAGVTRVRFEIDPDGHARGVEVARSSGHSVLDRAAERAVSEAGVLPWVYGRLEVPVRFELEDPS